MNRDKYAVWTELQNLATQYDWAVEGFGKPDDTRLTRDQARQVRELVLGTVNQLDKIYGFTCTVCDGTGRRTHENGKTFTCVPCGGTGKVA